MLGMVAIAPKVGRPSRHCLRRRLRGSGIAEIKSETPSGWLGKRGAQKTNSTAGYRKINIDSGRNTAAEKRHQCRDQGVRPPGGENHLCTGVIGFAAGRF